MYDYNHEQARMRLGGTIVGHKKEFFLIEDIRVGREGGLIAVAWELPFRNKMSLLKLQDIECFNYNLGYWNFANREALYVVRVPARQQRQGICDENLNVVTKDGLRRTRDYGRVSNCAQFIDMLKGEYPTFEEARRRLMAREAVSVAVSRDIAYRYDEDLEFYTLEYRGRTVAHGDIDRINLPTKFSYLREQLEQNKIKVA